ncbi:MAG: hypothetical protein PW788_01435 [Micavibrio sp.]|nr:hypothetical protein [Micavibrio sp.]
MVTQPNIGHLTNVGKTKAMGLLSFAEITALGHKPVALKDAFNAKAGFITRHFRAGDELWADTVTPAMESLAVIHAPSLQKLLDKNGALLARTGWPCGAEAFADKSFQDFVLRGDDAEQSALQALIKAAYNHPYPETLKPKNLLQKLLGF